MLISVILLTEITFTVLSVMCGLAAFSCWSNNEYPQLLISDILSSEIAFTGHLWFDVGHHFFMVPKWVPSSSNFCLYGIRNNIHSSLAVIAVCKHAPVCSRWITFHFCAFSTMTIILLALESFLVSMLSGSGQNFITTYY